MHGLCQHVTSAVGGMKSPNCSHEWPESGPWGQDDKGGEMTLG